MLEAAPQAQRNPIRRLYDWVLSWADTPYGVPALLVLSFTESSFFPIPPDILLIALALAKPERAFYYALLCTIASVLGGLFGYFIGYALWATVEPILIGSIISEANFEAVTGRYHQYGEIAVFAAAFTPIPYKVFTVAAGVAQLDLLKFAGASLCGRAGRFFLVSLVIRLAGPRAKELIERYFNAATIVGAILLIGGFALIKLLK